jgi:hypothetical protein
VEQRDCIGSAVSVDVKGDLGHPAEEAMKPQNTQCGIVARGGVEEEPAGNPARCDGSQQ